MTGDDSGDTGKPTVVITSTESSPTAADPIPITFTWSEGVYGFSSSSVTLTNATATELIIYGQNLYVLNVSPTGAGAVTAKVDAGECQDVSGNDNTASSTFSITAS